MENLGKSEKDNRIFERFAANFPLKYLDLDYNKEGSAKTLDISANGLGITTDECLPKHSNLELWLQIPDMGQPLYARAKVIWSDKSGTNACRAGIKLEKADFLGLARVLRIIGTRRN
ncbi:MAG: PilZ domain-containing protein [Candidatus Omnitrophica bacterium]|nr:PilZ domain-containing protein [Candidatus Omnitrophota bacterium]